MKVLHRSRRWVSLAAAVVLCSGLAVVAPQLGSTAGAQGASPSCADAVTGPPTGPATLSSETTPYGQVLVVGSGPYTGCSLYVLTSDQIHTLSGAGYACGSTSPLGPSCDAILWPALLTDGAPIAGSGVNPTLIGTVTRTDVLPGGEPVQQVTYGGLPLYRFFLDETPGETEGANLFDPITSPTGIWRLVNPSQGRPAVGQAFVQLETAFDAQTGTTQTVLAVSMNDTFSLFAGASFPVYTLSSDGGHQSSCQGVCAAVAWPPVLTSGRPQAGAGVDQHALGVIVRPDGTHQVTFDGQPLYLFQGDAYIQGIFGSQGINGGGLTTPWGTFETVPPSP